LFDRLDDAWGCSAALESLALVASALGSVIRSATLFGAADAQRHEAGAALAPTDLAVRERAIATLRLRAGMVACEAAVARGREMARRSAVAYARQTEANLALEASPAAPKVATLTGREREVVALVARGFSNQQIAQELIVTKHTADKHVGNVLGKLGLARAPSSPCGGSPRQAPTHLSLESKVARSAGEAAAS
jgi:non-specific serine/threonine protein kinase